MPTETEPAPTLPPPPPPPTTLGPTAGRLTMGWRLATLLGWAAAFFAFMGVWQATVELGLGTWWLGPPSRPFFVMLLPFVAPSAMLLLALYNARRLPWFGLLASAATALVGVCDLGREARFAVVELAIGAAMAVFSLASFAGRYRPVRSPP